METLGASGRRTTGVLSFWKTLLLPWLTPRQAAPVETTEDLIARLQGLRELLDGLGYDGGISREAAVLAQSLCEQVVAEVPDPEALRAAAATALARCDAEVPPLLRALAEAPDTASMEQLLNADPVHDQVAFVEQIPVLKNGVVTWASPVNHTLIRKRTANAARFSNTLTTLEALFATGHPARTESARLAVLEAIVRVRRELDRENGYLPTPLLYLETKLEEYRTGSLRPKAAEMTRLLLSILDRLAVSQANASAVAEQAVRYLESPRIHTRGLTNHMLSMLLAPELTDCGGISKSDARMMHLVRTEITAGSFDAEETVRRLRQLEAAGFRIHSIVFALLRAALSRSA